MRKELRSPEYLEKRVAALELFHGAVMDFFSSQPYCIGDVIDSSVLEAVDDTRPQTDEERKQASIEWIKSYTNRLPKEVDQTTRDYVLKYIDAHQMTPYYTGGSLHIWEERYKVDGECYSVWGEMGTNGHQAASVDLIIDPVDKA